MCNLFYIIFKEIKIFHNKIIYNYCEKFNSGRKRNLCTFAE